MKKQWSLFRFCVCSGEKLGFCDMKGVRMRKTILIALAIFLALSSSLNANESTEKSPLLNTSEVNSLLVEHRDFLKEVLDDVLNKNSSKMDKNLKESFWTVINYFQSLESSKSPSYQAITDLENAIVGFEDYPNIVAKLSQHRKEAINHFLQKVSPNLVNNQEFISILLAGQKEAELSGFWTRKFFKYLLKAHASSKPYLLKKLKKETPNFIASLTNWWQSFWKLSIYIVAIKWAERATKWAERATKWAERATALLEREKQETRDVTALLKKEKQETREVTEWVERAIKITQIARDMVKNLP